jgi:hypothetical protein
LLEETQGVAEAALQQVAMVALTNKVKAQIAHAQVVEEGVLPPALEELEVAEAQ